jgi:ribosomal protein L37AE/L43A
MPMIRILRREGRRSKLHPSPSLRPVCPICERPMERRASTVWMCPDFPRCPGSVAAD